jgi:multidrug efflux pump subunit AcrA (membrane-fusion protein)
MPKIINFGGIIKNRRKTVIMFNSKKTVISIAVIFSTIIALIIFNRAASKNDESFKFTEAVKGDFEISVSTPGELVSENSVEIKAPELRGRDVQGSDIKIQDIVPEGTVVKKGDYIATLDRTTFDNNLKSEIERLKTFSTDIEMKLMDTAVVLQNIRDQIKNQESLVEEAELTLSNSKYEPPAKIRQAEINLERQKRILEQRQRFYQLRVKQVERDVDHLRLWYSKVSKRVNDFEEVLNGFVITAPSPGMVIYKKDRRGTKLKAGSMVNAWDRVVATLPDLSSMLSKIYVSEIEINKIQKGQKVIVNVDAFPAKSFSGEVYSIANIGEKLPNSDSKVFEVMIKIVGNDPALRPSMTTGNKIVIKNFPDAIYIPTECLHAGTDGVPFVYLKNRTKQIVVPGESNEKNVVIEKGLKEGSVVYVIPPENHEEFRLAGEELIPLTKVNEETVQSN